MNYWCSRILVARSSCDRSSCSFSRRFESMFCLSDALWRSCCNVWSRRSDSSRRLSSSFLSVFFFWLAESDLKVDREKMISARSRCMWLTFFSTRCKSKTSDWTWILMIKFFKQSKIFKTRVLSIVFWFLFRFRRSCRTWSRKWVQCSFENKVNVIVTSSVDHVLKNILISKNREEDF